MDCLFLLFVFIIGGRRDIPPPQTPSNNSSDFVCKFVNVSKWYLDTMQKPSFTLSDKGRLNLLKLTPLQDRW